MKKIYLFMAAATLTMGLAGCSENDTEGSGTGTAHEVTLEGTTGGNTTRSSFTGTMVGGTDITYYWEPTSETVYLDDGATQSALSASITAKTNFARFKGTTTITAAAPTVYYPGKSSTTYNKVTIAAAQAQTTVDNSDHIGTDGDCGTATGDNVKKVKDGQYTFTLTHSPSFLCFLPYSRTNENTQAYKDYTLESIAVTSADDIAGTYTLQADGTMGTAISGTGSKTITLTTSSFSMNATAKSQATNASYMVIQPGTHTLTCVYTLKNGATTLKIKKTLGSFEYAANTVYPIGANLDNGTIYYTVTYKADNKTIGTIPTDANSPYEANSTVTVMDGSGLTGPNATPYFNYWTDGTNKYYKGDTFTITANKTLTAVWSDIRHFYVSPYTQWHAAKTYDVYNYGSTYTENGISVSNPSYHDTGTSTANTTMNCPSKSDLNYYVGQTSFWDTDGPVYSVTVPASSTSLATTANVCTVTTSADGKYKTVTTKNGRWFRKKSPTGTAATTLAQARSSIDYFFLPAAGNYSDDLLGYAGTDGRYWSSTPTDTYAWTLCFNSDYAYVSNGSRGFGFCLWAAQ